VYANQPKFALVYDAGGKFDRSFNQSAYEGAERFKKETKISYIDVQVMSHAQGEQVLRNLARKGINLIAAVGFTHAQQVQTVAKEFPNTKFVIIDGAANGANVSSILFKEQEGSYLVGITAAMASKSKKLGFIGGIDIPLIRSFVCGYSQGAKSIDPKITITQNVVGTTATAWNDPAKGSELARAQMERGIDVIFAAAGGSGMGALQAAKEKGKLGIGVDSNQNYLFPGFILTSMVKRVDNALYENFMHMKNGTWKAGTTHLGLKEGGVDWALDKDNRNLITPEIEKRVNAAKQDILSGKVKVVDYREKSSCPV
jgi:basic membrane protein A